MAIKIRCVKAKLEDLTKEGTYMAYASIFGNVDSDGDIIKQGAFKKTLKKTKGFIPLVWMHNPTDPVGKAHGEEDEKGLLIRGEINLESQRGQEVYSFMKQGTVGDHSFAFEPNMKKSERIEDDDGKLTGFEFHEVKLFEASPLINGFAANDQANLIGLKFRDMYQAVKDGKESPETIIRTVIELDGIKIAEGIASAPKHNVDSVDKEAMAAFMATIKDIKQTLQSYERS